MSKFRKLKADEIECRVSIVKSNGISLLLYKDARCDMNILDEEIGPMNWTRSHSRNNANCTVSIWDQDKCQWISKEDTGKESFTEKEKGLASDSFKRACFNWGIGRELYTAPFIWINEFKCKIEEKKDKKGFTCSDNFYVSVIDYDEMGCISVLQIKNSKTHKVVYELGQVEEQVDVEEENTGSEPTKEYVVTVPQINSLRNVFEKNGIDECKVLVLYKVENIEELTISKYKNAMSHIKELKEKCGV